MAPLPVLPFFVDQFRNTVDDHEAAILASRLDQHAAALNVLFPEIARGRVVACHVGFSALLGFGANLYQTTGIFLLAGGGLRAWRTLAYRMKKILGSWFLVIGNQDERPNNL